MSMQTATQPVELYRRENGDEWEQWGWGRWEPEPAASDAELCRGLHLFLNKAVLEKFPFPEDRPKPGDLLAHAVVAEGRELAVDGFGKEKERL